MHPVDPTIPRFPTAGERDRRYGEWIAAGNTLRDGMACFVRDGGLYVYRDGQWKAT